MSEIQFCLLTHTNELAKSTNTGKLVMEVMPDTLIIHWSRVEMPLLLLDSIESNDVDVYLVMPGQFAIYQKAERKEVLQNKKKLFVLLDGTWQQARKMYRQSPYLHELALYSLNEVPLSVYTLRRNQQDGGLCTAEVAAQIMKQSGKEQKAAKLMTRLISFCESFNK